MWRVKDKTIVDVNTLVWITVKVTDVLVIIQWVNMRIQTVRMIVNGAVKNVIMDSLGNDLTFLVLIAVKSKVVSDVKTGEAVLDVILAMVIGKNGMVLVGSIFVCNIF